MVRDGPAQPPPPDGESPPYPAEKARGGEIILRTRGQRIIFIGGLIGMVMLALLWRIFL